MGASRNFRPLLLICLLSILVGFGCSKKREREEKDILLEAYQQHEGNLPKALDHIGISYGINKAGAVVTVGMVGGDTDLAARKRITDDALRILGQHHQIYELGLKDTDISDRGLRHISQLRQLEFLDLSNTAITAAGVRQLSKLDKLTYLDLDGTSAGDPALSIICHNFDRLENLSLGNTSISDKGVVNISSLSNLRMLWLKSASVTDNSLDPIVKARTLEDLAIGGANFRADNLEKLAQLPKLESLSLFCENLADEKSTALTECEKLKDISLYGPATLSLDKMRELHRRLGGCEVINYLDVGHRAVRSNGRVDIDIEADLGE